MSFKIEYFENVPLKGSCKLLDDQLKTSTNQTLTFPTSGGTLATTADISGGLDLSDYVTKSGTETLTNKTLTTPTIASIKNASYTLTVPSKTGTLATTSDIPAAPDLSSYATQTWVTNKNYLTAHQDLSSYATQTWVTNKNYLTAHQDLSDYAKKTELHTHTVTTKTVYLASSSYNLDTNTDNSFVKYVKVFLASNTYLVHASFTMTTSAAAKIFTAALNEALPANKNGSNLVFPVLQNGNVTIMSTNWKSMAFTFAENKNSGTTLNGDFVYISSN